MHACMRIEVAGRPHPMLMRTARWDGTLGGLRHLAGRRRAARRRRQGARKGRHHRQPRPAAAGHPALDGDRHPRTDGLVQQELDRHRSQGPSAGLQGHGRGRCRRSGRCSSMPRPVSSTPTPSSLPPTPRWSPTTSAARPRRTPRPSLAYAALGIIETLTRGRDARSRCGPTTTSSSTSPTPTPVTPTPNAAIPRRPAVSSSTSHRRRRRVSAIEPLRIVGGTPFVLFSFDAAVGRTPLTHLHRGDQRGSAVLPWSADSGGGAAGRPTRGARQPENRGATHRDDAAAGRHRRLALADGQDRRADAAGCRAAAVFR